MKVDVRAFDLGSNNDVVTAFANDYGYEHVFSFQLGTLAQPGDVLITISTSGKSQNVLNAIELGKKKNLYVIELRGKDGDTTQKIENDLSSDLHKVIINLGET